MRMFRLFIFSAFAFLLLILWPRAAFAASREEIILQPSFLQLPLGAEFTVDVVVRSDKPIIGSDVKILFDKAIAEVKSIDAGDAFELVPLKQINPGEVKITGLNRSRTFTGTGKLASLRVKAKDAGDIKLNVELSPESTIDSNLTTDEVKDILIKADSGRYLVGSTFQRSTSTLKRLISRILPFLIFIVVVFIVGFLIYKWWMYQKKNKVDVFIPEKVPLDKPPV